jgi:GNAT superfamily N-acetyltransferase
MNEDQHNPLIVRAATVADAAPLAVLARELLTYERSLNEAMRELTPWAASPDELRKQIRQPNLRFFIAERNGELLGYVKAMIYGRALKRAEIGYARWLKDGVERAAQRTFNWAMRRPRPNVRLTGGYIAGAFVREDARRTRIGRALIAAAEDWFRQHGLTTSELHVLYSNERARQFWENVGYQPLAMGMRKKL